MAVPVNEQTFEWKRDDGYTEFIPAIDRRWVDQDKEYGRFDIFAMADNASLVTWQNDMRTMLGGLRWLRRLPCHRFWSTVIYDDDVHEMLDSYLEKCPRYTEREALEPLFFGNSKEIDQLMDQIHKCVMVVLIRMATHRESPTTFLSPDYFARIVEDNAIWTVSKVINYCSIFGEDNQKLVSKVINALFDSQPKLIANLKQRAGFVFNEKGIVESASERAERLSRGAHEEELQGVVSTLNQDLIQRDQIREFVYYLLEVVYALNQLSHIYQSSLEIFEEFDAASKIPTFCQTVVSKLTEEIEAQTELGGFTKDKSLLLGRIELFHHQSVELFFNLVNHNYLKPIGNTVKGSQELFNKFLEMITENLMHDDFIWLYNNLHPIVADIERLCSKGISVDSVQLQYISDVLRNISDSQCKKVIENVKGRGVLAGLGILCTPELEEKVLGVTDLFPDVSPAFAHLCLRHFKMDSDRTIDALCNRTSKLPQNIRKCFDIATHLTEDDIKFDPSFLSSIIDDDESGDDVVEILDDLSLETPSSVQNGIPASDIEADDLEAVAQLVPLTTGKKHENWKDEKRSEVQQMKEFYEQFQYEPPSDEDTERMMYEDEYDDTYDSTTNIPEAGTADEFWIRRRQRQGALPAEPEEESESDEEGNEIENGTAKAAGSTRPQVAQESRPFRGDYTGGQKRQFKERHKGRLAHHDRKERASKKLAKGMF